MNLNFGGNWFPNCCSERDGSNVVIGSLEECFSLNKLIWCFKGCEIHKIKKKIYVRGLEAPSDYTGGTKLKVPPGPLGLIWVTQIFTRAEPI